MLREFSLQGTVTPGEARHDKVVMRVRHRVYSGTTEELESFRHFLAVPPAGGEIAEPFGRLFNRPGHTANSWRPMELRRRGASPPLFSGTYDFIPRMIISDAPVQADLNLSLNPTRFLRYQADGYIPPRREFGASSARLYKVARENPEGEYALDGLDNWLPNTPGFQHLKHPALIERALRDYFGGVMREADRETERAATDLHVQLPFVDNAVPDRFSLKMVETFFEFSVPDGASIDRVRSMEPLLQSFGELGQTSRDYPAAGPHQWTKNSRVLKLAVRTGVTLKIYAKTNRRIRFEVTHDLAKARFRGAANTAATGRLLRSKGALGEVYPVLKQVRTDAAGIVNRVLVHMRNQASFPSTPKTAVDLLFDIAHTVGNAQNARTLLSVLLHKGSITTQAELREPLRKLQRAGIVQTRNESRRREYVVTSRYRHPLRALREHAGFPNLTTRHRTRNQ